MQCPACQTAMTASTAGWLCPNCGQTEAGDPQALATAMASQVQPQPKPPVSSGPAHPINVYVDQSVWHYLGPLSVLYVLAWIGSLAWLGICIYGMVYYDVRFQGNSGAIVVLPLLAMFGWYGGIKKAVVTQMLEKFAEANGFDFQKQAGIDRTYGNLFRMPGTGAFSDVVHGQYDGRQIWFFLYDRTVQQGRSSTTYHYSILDLKLPAATPHILVRHKSRLNQWDAVATKDLAPLQLEGDFNDKLEAWVAKGNEVQALTVLSPDVMAVVADHIDRFDIEFVGDRFYAYLNGYVKTSQDLSGMIELADMVLDKVVPVLQRNRDTAELITPSPHSGLDVRQLQWQGLPIVIGIIVAGIVAGIVFTSVSASQQIRLSNPKEAAFNRAYDQARADADNHSVDGAKLVQDAQAMNSARNSIDELTTTDYYLALGYGREDDFEQALAAVNDGLAVFPDDQELLLLKGQLLVDDGDNQQALQIAKKVELLNVQYGPTRHSDAWALNLEAVAQHNLGSQSAALAAQAKAASAAPGDGQVAAWNDLIAQSGPLSYLF